MARSCCSCFPLQILEFDLKGSPLDSSSFIDVVVKDYETIGKDKYAPCHFWQSFKDIYIAWIIAQMHQTLSFSVSTGRALNEVDERCENHFMSGLLTPTLFLY